MKIKVVVELDIDKDYKEICEDGEELVWSFFGEIITYDDPAISIIDAIKNMLLVDINHYDLEKWEVVNTQYIISE